MSDGTKTATGWAIVDQSGKPMAGNTGYTKQTTINAWIGNGRWTWSKWRRIGIRCVRVDIVPKAKVDQ